MKTVNEAIEAKLVWKPGTITDYARALLTEAVRLHWKGVPYFNNDDVAEADQPGDKTTVGAAVRMLINAKIIEATGVHLPDRGIRFGQRASTRVGNHGHRNQLYALTNHAIAQEWLERHGGSVEVAQLEIAL